MKNKLLVAGKSIKITKTGTEDYMSLTELYNTFGKEGSRTIETFIRSTDIIEFLTEWETVHNPNFKVDTGVDIKEDAKNKVNQMSISKWTEQTNAIGIYSIKGKYGGTYAHATIALRFCSYLSKKLEVTVYQDYLKYKQLEFASARTELRQDAADEYKTMCKMVDTELKPNLPLNKQKWVYSEEADLINKILFGLTAKEWELKYPHLAVKNYNQRDYATQAELECINKMQIKNTFLIEAHISKEKRILSLQKQVELTLPHLIKSRGLETKRPLTELL